MRTLGWRRRAAIAIVGLAAVAGIGLAPARAGAQGGFILGAGPGFPVGAIGGHSSTGFNALAAFGVHIPFTPLAIRVDAAFDQFGYNNNVSGNARVFSGTANAVFTFPGSILRPYVIAGFGLYHAPSIVGASGNPSTLSSYASGVNGGVGTRIGAVTGIGFFAEARLHYVFTPGSRTEFIPLTVGIAF